MDAARNGILDYEEEEEEKISAIGDDFKQGNYIPVSDLRILYILPFVDSLKGKMRVLINSRL